jgi:hypothetical protein
MSPTSDDEFVHAFLHGALSPAQFHHRDHLRLAWCLIRQRGLEDAIRTVTASIRVFAIHHGQADRYHETLTRFWVSIVAHAVAARPEIGDFASFLAAFPQLLDKDLPYCHWQRATMGSPAARARWIEPDLLALPA